MEWLASNAGWIITSVTFIGSIVGIFIKQGRDKQKEVDAASNIQKEITDYREANDRRVAALEEALNQEKEQNRINYNKLDSEIDEKITATQESFRVALAEQNRLLQDSLNQMETRIDNKLSKIDEMNDSINGLKVDVSEIKKDISYMRDDIKELKDWKEREQNK